MFNENHCSVIVLVKLLFMFHQDAPCLHVGGLTLVQIGKSGNLPFSVAETIQQPEESSVKIRVKFCTEDSSAKNIETLKCWPTIEVVKENGFDFQHSRHLLNKKLFIVFASFRALYNIPSSEHLVLDQALLDAANAILGKVAHVPECTFIFAQSRLLIFATSVLSIFHGPKRPLAVDRKSFGPKIVLWALFLGTIFWVLFGTLHHTSFTLKANGMMLYSWRSTKSAPLANRLGGTEQSWSLALYEQCIFALWF